MSRDELLKKGWRRHSVISLSKDCIDILKHELPEKALEMASIDGAIAIIALYDCGVVYGSFEKEPWVQLLISIPVTFDKGLSKGRNARRLHFDIIKDNETYSFETNACGICQINRELLLLLENSESYIIKDDTKLDLKHWLAERFRQDTWPDSFNNAIKPREKQLKKFYKDYNNYVSGLYIKLDTYEELTEGKYTVSIIVAIEVGKQRGLIKHLKEKNSQLETKAIDKINNFFANLVKNAFGESVYFLEDRTNLELNIAIEVIEESNITLNHIREYSRFSPYSLSEFDTNTPIPAEMIPAKTY